ncbi:insulinase family protein [Aerococcaceae bacterium WGS1372]
MTFKLIETKELDDIHSVGHLYLHTETGAQVLHLDNDDTNKAFTIAFKTPPYNDNGIAHILEHSVLNGSKKFPSKEPFVELVKGSLNTFVNAMTFSDKTIYPVASTNQKDFNNLMSVYLDAVFEPLLYSNPQILEQEGWHYHLENADDDLIYKGVVYNEMKGAMASADSQLFHAIKKHLLEGTPYQYESGGLPSAIPTLTQEAFVDFHKTYYHPSNSLTILYGDLDTDVAFSMLAEYFDGHEPLQEEIDLAIDPSVPSQQDIDLTYSITDGDDPIGKDYNALAWNIGDITNPLTGNAMKILAEVLFGNNEAPLKKTLLDAGIGGDISGDAVQIGYPNLFVMTAKYSQADKMNEFKNLVDSTLSELVTKGIPKDLIRAAINKFTFTTKESVISESNPRGVLYAINALQGWLYEESPFDYLEFSTYLDQLSVLVESDYFEKLIEDKLLNNDYRVNIRLIAEAGKNDRLEKESLAKLQEYKASLSDQDIDSLVAQTQSLISRQETPDTAEDLATIPTLEREDLTSETEDHPLVISDLFNGTQFYHSDQFTSGIDYIDFYFDIADFEAEDYLLLSYLSQLLGDLSTKNYTLGELQTQIDLHTGGIHGGVVVYEDHINDELKPYFTIRAKALEESSDKLLELTKEILTNTLFTKESELLNVTQEHISEFEDTINYSSHTLAANRALSHIKASSKLGELINGIDQFNYTKDVLNKLKQSDSSELSEKLEVMMQRLLNTSRINVLYIGENRRVEAVKEAVLQTFNDLIGEPLGQAVEYQAGEKANEAFITAQDVNYVGLASDALIGHLGFSGPSLVLSNLLRYDYLWNNIRVKGGAYGSMFRQLLNGGIQLSSYRDPNIAKTLDTYRGISDFIANIELDEASLLKTIIGTMSNLDQPLSAYHKGKRAFSQYQTSRTTADTIQLKEEVLATTQAELNALSDAFKAIIDQGTVAVIGNKAQIDQEKDLFDTVSDLF